VESDGFSAGEGIEAARNGHTARRGEVNRMHGASGPDRVRTAADYHLGEIDLEAVLARCQPSRAHDPTVYLCAGRQNHAPLGGNITHELRVKSSAGRIGGGNSVERPHDEPGAGGDGGGGSIAGRCQREERNSEEKRGCYFHS